MHADTQLRQAFCDALESYIRSDDDRAGADLDSASGQLWNCTDQLPDMYRDDVEVLCQRGIEANGWRGGTYAKAARIVRRHFGRLRAGALQTRINNLDAAQKKRLREHLISAGFSPAQ